MSENPINLHEGHRNKVKKRFLESGMEGMADHNILEMLLFYAIPRKDTNEIAHRLIEKFGSFSGVLKADFDDLKEVEGISDNSACLITMLLPIYKRFQDDYYSEKTVLKTTDDIVRYILPKFIDSENERVFAICFDSKQRVISTKLLCEGDFSSANFEIKKLAKIVLQLNASSVVLVHNHPNYIALPSNADIETTKTIYEFLDSIKVKLSDHIIVAKNAESCSMLNNPKYTHLFYGLESLFD